MGFSDEETVDLSLIVGERKYSSEEVQKIFQGVLEHLEEQILGENESLEAVRKNLVFPGSFCDGIVTAVWSVDPPDYIDDTGRFLSEPPKEGILATVKVTLTCEKEELIREFPVKLLPPERTELEEKAVELKAEAEENGEKTREAEEMVLPDSWKGTPIRWGMREDSPLGVGFLLLAVGLWYLYGKDDRELKKEEKHRKQQMILDYPVILYKMSMLLEAGMTIRGAFSKVAFHYRDQNGKEVHYAYEEMLLACYEMEQGVGEAAAYESLGRNAWKSSLSEIRFAALPKPEKRLPGRWWNFWNRRRKMEWKSGRAGEEAGRRGRYEAFASDAAHAYSGDCDTDGSGDFVFLKAGRIRKRRFVIWIM